VLILYLHRITSLKPIKFAYSIPMTYRFLYSILNYNYDNGVLMNMSKYIIIIAISMAYF